MAGLINQLINPPMVKPFRLIYQAKGAGGAEERGGFQPPSLNLNHCLSDILLIVNL